MADEKAEKKDEREYIVPLRKGCDKTPYYRRTKRAIRVLKLFIIRHMKIYDKDMNKVKVELAEMPAEIKFRMEKEKKRFIEKPKEEKAEDKAKEEKKEEVKEDIGEKDKVEDKAKEEEKKEVEKEKDKSVEAAEKIRELEQKKERKHEAKWPKGLKHSVRTASQNSDKN